jgi:hypothetical protein
MTPTTAASSVPDVYLALKYREDHANRELVERIHRTIAERGLTMF